MRLRRRSERALAALLVPFLLAAAPTTCAQSPTAVQRSERIAAMRRWAARGPASYDVTVSRNCMCAPDALRGVVVSVRDGQVTSRRYADDGTDVPQAYAATVPTVDGLFALIADAEARQAAISATYDATLGYPKSVYLDYDVKMVDEELGFTLLNFHAR